MLATFVKRSDLERLHNASTEKQAQQQWESLHEQMIEEGKSGHYLSNVKSNVKSKCLELENARLQKLVQQLQAKPKLSFADAVRSPSLQQIRVVRATAGPKLVPKHDTKSGYKTGSSSDSEVCHVSTAHRHEQMKRACHSSLSDEGESDQQSYENWFQQCVRARQSSEILYKDATSLGRCL